MQIVLRHPPDFCKSRSPSGSFTAFRMTAGTYNGNGKDNSVGWDVVDIVLEEEPMSQKRDMAHPNLCRGKK